MKISALFSLLSLRHDGTCRKYRLCKLKNEQLPVKLSFRISIFIPETKKVGDA